jgi:hypothetical protein
MAPGMRIFDLAGRALPYGDHPAGVFIYQQRAGEAAHLVPLFRQQGNN